MDFYVLDCSVEKCDAEFYLNDIPVILRGEEAGKQLNGPMNQLIRDGLNKLEIVINPGPCPSEALGVPGEPRQRLVPEEGAFARAKIAKYPLGAVVGGPDEEELIAVEWTAEADAPAVFPRTVGVTGDFGEVFGPANWEDAERLVLDEDTVKEINEFVLAVHGYILVQDFTLFAELQRPRGEAVDVAYGKRPGATEELIKVDMENSSSKSSWAMAPLKTGEFDFRICANDKLVECVNKQRRPVLEEEPDKDESINRYPMMIGKLDSEWKIFR